MESVSSPSVLGCKHLSICLVDCMKTPGVLRPEPEAPSSDLPVLTLRELSISLVDCMKTPVLNSDDNHSSLELKLKEEDEQLGREYEGSKLELHPVWQDSGVGPEIHLYKEEEENKNNISVETKPEEVARSDGTTLVFQENAGGTKGMAWLIQCSELSESVETAALGPSSEEEMDATLQQSQEEDALSDRMETAQQDTEAEEAEDAETPKSGAPSCVSSTNENQTENQQEAASEPRHHRCEHCGKSFARKSNVLRHQRHNCSRTKSTEDSDQLEQETFSCSRCILTFDTKRGLKLHELCHKENSESHEGKESNEVQRERPHTCTQCNKSFYVLYTLRQHLLTHTGEKSYHCEVCGKQFGREGTLKEHMLIHTGEKPYKCDQCGKTCARRGDLRIHMLSHSEERPHNCSQCGKSFKQLFKLRKHERIHTGSRQRTRWMPM
uniref:C2H2-type domain-containing protein n=1 Tax=Oreochromis aureus TaxID=47969 RepID=A0A668T4H3_OREAU